MGPKRICGESYCLGPRRGKNSGLKNEMLGEFWARERDMGRVLGSKRRWRVNGIREGGQKVCFPEGKGAEGIFSGGMGGSEITEMSE